MTMLALAKGSVFAGRYRVVRSIAQGGMGAVYEVEHIETERRRALKVMLPHLVSSDELRQRFRQEARIAAKVESAYIVDVFDAGIDDATTMPFLVMELLRGEEIGKRLKRLGRLPIDEAVSYLWQTALALDKTHRANIVHRDLKPENLFLAEQDDGPPRIKVLDFGIAKLIAEQGTEANATQSIGTPLYMAPEQFRSGSKMSPATDLFALGMMAFSLLVGVSYWQQEKEVHGNVYSFVAVVMFGPTESGLARAARRGVSLPPAFEAWFARATASAPQDRFDSATEMIRALASACGVSVTATGSAGQTTFGQTPPEQPFPGQTPPGQAPPADEPSTINLGGTRAVAEPATHASGFGLSSSQSTNALVDAAASASVSVQVKRRSTVFPVVAGVALSVVAIGLVAIGATNRTTQVDLPAKPAVSPVVQSKPVEVPSVVPVASSAPPVTEPIPDAGAHEQPPSKVRVTTLPTPTPTPTPTPSPSPTSPPLSAKTAVVPAVRPTSTVLDVGDRK